MQCRKLHIENNSKDIVWFGSYGKNQDGTAKKDVNYVSNEEAVTHSLIPRLSIIKGELWYEPTYGIPLLDRIRSKDIFDSTLIKMITIHPQVSGIKSIESTVNGHTYVFNVKINSIYGTEVSISNSGS